VGTPVNHESVVLGQVLREIREDLGWSTIRASIETGGEISVSAVGMYERGERQVSLPVFDRLCRAYDVDPGYVLAVARRRLNLSGDVHAPA
jgi:transcriptional regulator with XRE-family HTH domain